MAKLKKNRTYYLGRPVKEGVNYAQKTVYVDAKGKTNTSKTYSSKAGDFANGFMGFGVSERAIKISQKEFDKLKA
jgi:hypothetical protein